MANYNIVVDSKFTPFSYQEMLAPVLMATQQHQALEEQYADLSAKASAWAAKANKESDPYAYNMYKTYANDLEKKAGNLARQGLQQGGTSVRDMLGMKSRYNEEILPIEQAYLTRQKQMGDQQKATFTDPSLMYSRDASTTSLDDYIKNPQISYEVRSGKMLAAQVSTAAAALAKEARENPEEWKSILGGQYYEKLKAKGFSSDAVLEAIKNSPNASPKLTKIVDDVIASSGIEGWNNADILERAKAYAREGLWSAVGESTNQTLKNENYLNPMQRYQLKRMKEEDDAKKISQAGELLLIH